MRKICIVGGVAGGATAATKLRRLSEEDQIIVFERDEYISFANCGLPYYIGNVIEDREDLLVTTASDMMDRFRIDVRPFNEVLTIDKASKQLQVFDKQQNKTYSESYDVLILSPGASPIVPNFKGLSDAKSLFVLRNVAHTDAIVEHIKAHQPKKATVIGGGFIGVEMAENLRHIGLDVTLVDMAPQVLAPLDFELAQLLHQHLVDQQVKLILNDGVAEILNQGKTIVTTKNQRIETDLIILAIGVSSEIKLAKEANLKIGALNGIVVNEFMQTSDPAIYALGDAIEVISRVHQKPIKIPLAWPANRQAIVAANHINGIADSYKGTLGTSVAKVFSLTAASTGLNQRVAMTFFDDVESVTIKRYNHASYYPNASEIFMKLVFSNKTGKIYGAQAVGEEGVEKRIDVLATAIIAGLTVDQLIDLELAYAPPYGSAKDPVNILGYVASAILKQTYKTLKWHQVDDFMQQGGIVIDVRTDEEYQQEHIKGSKNIELDTLRENLDQLPSKETPILITCRVGHRGYLAVMILQHLGYNVLNLDGGIDCYLAAKKVF